MPKDLVDRVHEFCKKHDLFQPSSTVVVGLSGGPDSVCLLHILTTLSYNLKLIAAHLDHQWRENSHEDVAFCKEYAHSLGIAYISLKASEIQPSKRYNGSKEEWGRILRRTFLESVAQEHNASAIALGHHQDDQQETFFIRMTRGASISGLASMRPKHGLYVRPLLSVHKADILEYLKTKNLSYIHDSTNDNDAFLRNAFRQVLPALKACDERFDDMFAQTLEELLFTDAFLERLTQEKFQEMSQEKEGTLWVDVKTLLGTDNYLHHRLILTWLRAAKVTFTPTSSFFNEIERFLKNKNKKHQVTKKWHILKDKGLASIQID